MPPTGLADGFGQEVPYGRIWGLLPIHPGKKWVPGSADRGFGGPTVEGPRGPGNDTAREPMVGTHDRVP
ncbi:hypothetical protein GCM10010116_34070 [Microbispora rosea subsp. aerata]|nr:hypothetical protein GCM10010116_34070 [Microbispora rosea subsp. aerata]GIH55981.1 hypothetical protein Mro02_28950 [Microbispora rosea subsp. aerata]GLJ87273.1 hypothetical protein GCM10017588_60180 [Microbispora rosea subsp. aerata]